MQFNVANLKIAHKGLLLALVPIVTGLIFLTAVMLMLEDAERVATAKALSASIQTELSRMGQMGYDAASTMSTYAVTGQQAYLDRYEKNKVELEKCYKKLSTLMLDQPDQLKRLDHARLVQHRYIKMLDELHDKRDLGKTMDLMSIRGIREQMQGLLRQFLDDLTTVQAIQEKANNTANLNPEESRKRVKLLIWFGEAFSVFLGFFLVVYYTRSITKPIDTIMNNAVRLATRQPLLPPIRGQDELARLDKIFHEMADALAEAAGRERAMIDNAVDVIFSSDVNHRFTQVSPAARTVLGYEPDDLLGRRIVDILADDSERTLATLNANQESESTTSIENKVKRKDGSIIYMLWTIQWSKEQQCNFVVAHDMTARRGAELVLRENEARVRIIIESLPVALMISSSEGIIEMTNITTEQVFGYRDADLIGHHISLIFTGESKRTQLEVMESIYSNFLGRVTDLDAVKKDGSRVPVELSISRFELRGNPKLLAVAMDITERRKLERLKKEFVEMVGHDLRSPLTSILGTLELVKNGRYGDLNDKGQQSLTRCDQDLHRLISLIDELLDLEKMQSGNMTVDFEVIDIGSVVARSVSAVSYLASSNDIEVVTANHSLEAFGDGPKLVQVIVNLVSNAIKFSPRGSKITIDYSESGDKVEVKVTDEGRGIAPEFKDKIFERFQQVEKADHKEKGGKGLGLAICKAIVEAHGGTIGVDSAVGKGSTFWFKIPQPS